MKVLVTKLQAARRQLRSAITLWFNDGDPVSIMTLAYAAHELIHRAYRKKGLRGLLFDSQYVSEDQRKEFNLRLKAVPNFVKHDNRDDGSKAEDSASFDPDINIAFILFALIGLKKLSARYIGPEETAFLMWFRLHRPEWYLANGVDDPTPVEIVQTLKKLEPKKFFNAVLKYQRGSDAIS